MHIQNTWNTINFYNWPQIPEILLKNVYIYNCSYFFIILQIAKQQSTLYLKWPWHGVNKIWYTTHQAWFHTLPHCNNISRCPCSLHITWASHDLAPDLWSRSKMCSQDMALCDRVKALSCTLSSSSAGPILWWAYNQKYQRVITLIKLKLIQIHFNILYKNILK